MTINIITAATEAAKEGGTYAVDLSFEDEEDNDLTPNTILWDLRDADGEVINEKEDESVSGPAAAVTVVLQGADLPADPADGDYSHIWMVVHGTYNSSLGTNLPYYDQVRISVEPMKGNPVS